MAEPYFIWNGVDSRDMGLVVTSYPAQVMPAERVKQVTVPGRMGSMTTISGSGIYDSYIKSIGIGNRRRVDAQTLAAWLRGAGTLIIGNEPGFAYKARVLKEAQLARSFLNVYSGTVSFSVQPGKSRVPPESPITVNQSGTVIYNPGDLPARPIYELHGLGVMQLMLMPTSTYSWVQIDPTGEDLPIGLNGAIIDSDAMTVTTLDGSESLTEITNVLYNDIRGLWIPPHGSVTINLSEPSESEGEGEGEGEDESESEEPNGFTSQVIVTPRWRWL